MRSLVIAVERATGRLSAWVAELAAVSTLVLTAVVTFSIVMRFVFNTSLNWTDELATYCLLCMVFLGLTYTLTEGAHIRIDFFTDMMSLRARRLLEIAVWAIGTVFALLLVAGCYSAVENFVRRETYSTEGLDIPLYWAALPMLFGSVLFAMAMAVRLVRLMVIGPAGQPDHDVGGH